MPDMNPRELSLFNMLLGHADRVANSPSMDEGQIRIILQQVQADAARMQLEQAQTTRALQAPAPGFDATSRPATRTQNAARAVAQYVGG